jgi:hypothetical protein
MYCPNCAATIEGVKFCRGCGTNVELVPQAISGELAQVTDGSRRRKRRRQASIESATSSFFTGIGFILVSIAVMAFFPGGSTWWFWMLLPGFACIGTAVGQYLRLRSDREVMQSRLASPPQIPQAQPSQLEEPKAPTTSNLAEKASVTEHTTRNLG